MDSAEASSDGQDSLFCGQYSDENESVRELSYDELREREYLERQIEKALYEAGRALRTIRDRRLYRSTHKTFEEYCRQRFGFTRMTAANKIAAAGVIENLSTNGLQNSVGESGLSTNGLQNSGRYSYEVLPTSERQVRPLINLEASEQRICWEQAVEAAGGKVPSGRQVKDIVDKIRERTKLPNPYRVGEIAILIPRDNPELRGLSGCWGAIIRAGEYSCTIETWDNEYTVKIEHLSSLELSDDNCELMQKFLGRLRRLYQLPNKDAVIDNLLSFFGKQPKPYISEVQEELLATLEKRFGAR
ncbi:hypothetical protein NIES2101_13460 [Calothrix sp. HK-06]|nr:hypothetical protein NIES2101_13460 [Calothrix sp. HK-06]